MNNYAHIFDLLTRLRQVRYSPPSLKIMRDLYWACDYLKFQGFDTRFALEFED